VITAASVLFATRPLRSATSRGIGHHFPADLRATRHVQLGVLWESEAVGDALLGRALTKDVVVTIAPGAF
jgi:hypothetical protein